MVSKGRILNAQRVLVVAIGFALLVGVDWVLVQSSSATTKLAYGFLGEKWYSISLAGDQVGYMHNHTYRDQSGAWHFDATTNFLLAANEPVNLNKQLVFDATEPHALQTAKYRNFSDGIESSTSITKQDANYRAIVMRGHEANELILDWNFNLSDFLEIELWLDADEPQALAEKVAKSVDFERLQVTRRTYRVVQKNAEGYLIENATPIATTRTQLNHDFHPTSLSMAGIFDFAESSRDAALALSRLKRKTSYLIRLDQRLVNHTELKSLTLRLHYEPDSSANLHRLPDEFTSLHSPVVGRGDANDFIGETLTYPISHPLIQTMAQRALGVDSEQQIAKLVDLANSRLRYSEDRPAGSVLRALEQGRGECTDYADLFTTLARAIGLPARTIFGLAYKDGSNPAFMFHAWNEVYADGRWRSVDPTWNQTRLDATHIPLTGDEAAAMLIASAARAVELSVVDTEYF